MKIKKIVMIGVLCLSFTASALADGDTPGGNRNETPPPSIVQIILNLLTNY